MFSRSRWLLVLAALIIHVAARASYEQVITPGASDVSAQSSNVNTACDRLDDLDKYGKNKIATGPISWCLLRSLSAVTPVTSWLQHKVEGQYGGINTLWPLISTKEPWPPITGDHLKFMAWGLTSAAAGALWLLALVIIVPLLVCLCCRKFMCRTAHERNRTHRGCNHATFWICWILALVFCVGQIYYSAWTRADYNAAICLPQKRVYDAFRYGLDYDGKSFPSLLESYNSDLQVLNLVQDDSDSNAAATQVNKQLEDMASPLAVQDAELASKQGTALGVNGMTVSILPDLTSGLAYQEYTTSVTCSSSCSVSGVESQAITDYTTNLEQLQKAFTHLQTATARLGNRLIWERERHMDWAFPVYVTLCSLPVLGLAAALVLFINYLRSDDFKQEALSRYRRFAGFMLFGYAFWGIILFLGGGYMMMSLYFPADICHQMDKVLDGDISTDEHLQVFYNLNQADTAYRECLSPDGSGKLIDTSAVSGFENIDYSNTDIASKINTFGTAIDGELNTGFKAQLETTDLTIASSKTDIDALISTGLSDISRLKSRDFGCDFCVDCANQASANTQLYLSLSSMEKWPATTDLNTALSDVTNDNAAIAELYGTGSLRDALETCAPSGNTNDRRTFWEAAHVLMFIGSLHDSKWTQGTSPTITNVGFFRLLRDTNDPWAGATYVTYPEWNSGIKDSMVALANTLMAGDISDQIRNQHAGSRVARLSSDCTAARGAVEKIKDSVCDSLSGDLTSVATFAVWLAVLHLIAFIVLLIWWLPRRRYADYLKEHEPSTDEETQEAQPPKTGLTEAEFFRACEVGDQVTARKAAEQYPPNSVVDLNYNNTPLHVAAYWGHPAICQDLCQKGWDPNAFNFKRHTPFTACVSNLWLDVEVKKAVMIVLKDHGAWIDVYTGEGDTPLLIATRAEEKEIVALLLEWDANPFFRDEEFGWSSLRYAKSANNNEVYSLLREASPRHSPSPRRSPM